MDKQTSRTRGRCRLGKREGKRQNGARRGKRPGGEEQTAPTGHLGEDGLGGLRSRPAPRGHTRGHPPAAAGAGCRGRGGWR